MDKGRGQQSPPLPVQDFIDAAVRAPMQNLLGGRVPPGNSAQHHGKVYGATDADENICGRGVGPAGQNPRASLRARRFLRVISGLQIVVGTPALIDVVTMLQVLGCRRQNLSLSASPVILSVVPVDQIELRPACRILCHYRLLSVPTEYKSEFARSMRNSSRTLSASLFRAKSRMH